MSILRCDWIRTVMRENQHFIRVSRKLRHANYWLRFRLECGISTSLLPKKVALSCVKENLIISLKFYNPISPSDMMWEHKQTAE